MNHKHLTAAIRLAVIAGVGIATTVLAVDLSKLPPPSTQKGVTYDKDIMPIFKANCFDCHGANRPKHNLRLDSLAGVLKGSSDGEIVVAGKSDKSDLVLAICWEVGPENPMPPKPRGPRGMRAGGTNVPPTAPAPGAGAPGTPATPGMPPGGRAPVVHKELTPEQIGLVRAWIDQGAK